MTTSGLANMRILTVLSLIFGVCQALLDVKYKSGANDNTGNAGVQRRPTSSGSNSQPFGFSTTNDLDGNLKKCCAAYGAKATCVKNLCAYETSSEEVFCHAAECHNDLKRWVYCVNDEHDHTACCSREGVAAQCLLFCRGKTPLLTELLREDFHYMPCLTDLDKILKCAKDGVTKRNGHKKVCLNNSSPKKCAAAKAKFVNEPSAAFTSIFSLLKSQCDAR